MCIDDDEDDEIKLLTTVFLTGASPLCARLSKGSSKEALQGYSVEEWTNGLLLNVVGKCQERDWSAVYLNPWNKELLL